MMSVGIHTKTRAFTPAPMLSWDVFLVLWWLAKNQHLVMSSQSKQHINIPQAVTDKISDKHL